MVRIASEKAIDRAFNSSLVEGNKPGRTARKHAKAKKGKVIMIDLMICLYSVLRVVKTTNRRFQKISSKETENQVHFSILVFHQWNKNDKFVLRCESAHFYLFA